MTHGALQVMGNDPHILPSRLARYVAPIPAKRLARQIGCDVRTAENIKRGHWPIARHWIGLIRTFGEDITEAVFHPEKAAARLEREVLDLEQQLAEKRAALVASAGSRAPKAGRPVQDRAAVGAPPFSP